MKKPKRPSRRSGLKQPWMFPQQELRFAGEHWKIESACAAKKCWSPRFDKQNGQPVQPHPHARNAVKPARRAWSDKRVLLLSDDMFIRTIGRPSRIPFEYEP